MKRKKAKKMGYIHAASFAAAMVGFLIAGSYVGERVRNKTSFPKDQMIESESYRVRDIPFQEMTAKEFFLFLRPGDCFREEGTFGTTASFEKSFDYKSHIFVVIEQDKKNGALLIAQPNPECEAPEDESDRCGYWFRTVHRNNIYLISDGGNVRFQCPKGLTRADMIKILKASDYAKKYKVD